MQHIGSPDSPRNLICSYALAQQLLESAAAVSRHFLSISVSTRVGSIIFQRYAVSNDFQMFLKAIDLVQRGASGPKKKRRSN